MQTDVIYNHDLISLRCERSWVERESRLFRKSASILASLGLVGRYAMVVFFLLLALGCASGNLEMCSSPFRFY